ncbi:MAG: aminopeptidase [Sphingorhabdus sp.]|nr:aminopeptidase [Sphingorhabdus sp.]
MLLNVARFELKYQLRNPVFWVSLFLFFLLGFGVTASENVSMGTPGTVHENAPFAIASMIALSSLFYLFVITSFVANAVVRDDTTGYGPIIKATSIGKRNYVLGRFMGGLGVALLGFFAVPVGMLVGVSMPWVDPETVGPNNPAYYLWPYLILAVPNILLMSSLLFGFATITRSMLWSYIGVVIFFMGYLITTTLLASKIEYQQIMAMVEPLGFGALSESTRYWTAADMNAKLLPLDSNMLINRALVIGLSVILLLATYWRFSMAERAPSKRMLNKLARDRSTESAPVSTSRIAVVAATQRFDAGSVRAQFMTRLKTEIMQVLRSPGLIVLLLLAVINTGAGLFLTQTLFGTPSHPLTANIITNVQQGFAIFLLIIAVFYGGELVWRERDVKIGEIIDSTPTPNWAITLPKVLAILLVLMLLNGVAMATGLLYQLIKGAPEFGLSSYFAWFLVPMTVDMLLIAILAVFFQALSPNKYVGWGLFLVWFIAGIFLVNMGYTNALYRYGSNPAEPLSDMNGSGGFAYGAWVLRAYWMAFAVILMVVAHIVWPRGTDTRWRSRLQRIRHGMRGAPLALIGAALVAMIGTGAYAWYNFKILNRFETSDEIEKLTADYEKRYLKYEKLPRPVVTAVKFDAQIFPKQKRLAVTGQYKLRNDTGAPISEVHIRQGNRDTKFSALEIKGAKLARYDEKYRYRFYRFDTPLAPGAETELNFQSEIWHRGFRNGLPETSVNLNGTFVNNFDFAPIIGMNRQSALQDRTVRRRQGLPAELRPAKLEDMSATRENYVRTDWVMSDITVTTDADQVPIAPGRKVADATKDGRRTAHFVSSAPIHNFLSIQSARYKLTSKNYKGVELTIFHDPRHEWNVPAMLKALEEGLDYYQANFGPYQFDHARIIEFPGYQVFAQAFAGTMPYSENIGFAADVTDPESIDYVTYVTAHELGHQYWAHQVIGADMQGNTITSETLAQYSALMVMKKIYGPDKIRRFLKYELDRYLAGRKGDPIGELPLYRVENQDYVHYRKGSLVMYLLQERLGEDAVNRALARFIQTWKFKGAPYHRSVDLIAEFRKEAKTPEDQALITDLFERITVYDFKAKEAKAKKLANGLWQTTISVEAAKYYADAKGNEKDAPLSEPIEVGLFNARPGVGAFGKADVVSIERKPVKGGKQQIVVTSKAKPKFAGIDPYNFYIDRNSDDNIIDVTG